MNRGAAEIGVAVLFMLPVLIFGLPVQGTPNEVPVPKVAVKPEVVEKLGQHGVDRIVFVKRFTYDANHYYTEYINSTWRPGGNLCILDLKTGSVDELVPQLNGGVFERFDVSFDARKLVFAWKAGPNLGYRIYEVNADGTGLRQLTFPPPRTRRS